MKNLMPEVAKLLGVEIGEEFRIDNPGADGRYKINEFGNLMYASSSAGEWDESLCFKINSLLSGLHTIIKVPFKPKHGEEYWTVEEDRLFGDDWTDSLVDYSYLKLGNCFRTKEEAEANADRIRKEIMG